MIALLALALHITAQPAKLQLGTDASARVTVALPAGASGLRLSASAGSLGPALLQGGGTYTAAYTPPDDTVPQVAIIAAVAQTPAGLVSAYVALPLWGVGDAVVTTRRNARIEVSIGDRTFGPVKADETGTALVPVVVPPGVRSARHGNRDIDLHIPPQRRVHVVLGGEAAFADRSEEIAVFAFQVASDGSPASSPSFELRTPRGSLGPLEPLGPGVWKSSWRLPPGTTGIARLTAFAGGPDLDATASLAVIPGPAARVEWQADRASVRAGEGELRLGARAFDAEGNPSNERLGFVVQPGEVSAVAGASGEWSLRVLVPPRFGGSEALRIEALSPSRREVVGSMTMPLVAADPAEARAREVVPVHADGASAARIRFSVADRFGNPVSALSPHASADRGSVGAVSATGPGEYLALYVPPVSRLDVSPANVSIAAGAAQVRARVPLLPQLPAFSVSPKVGAVSNLRDLTSPLAGLEVAWRTDRLGPKLLFAGDLSYWFSQDTASFSDATAQPVGTRSRTDFLTLAATAGARFDLGVRTRAFVLAGPALIHLWSHLRVSGQPTSYDTASLFGAQVGAGVERAMWGGVPFAEARFGFFADPALHGVISGPLRTFSLSAGYRFEML